MGVMGGFHRVGNSKAEDGRPTIGRSFVRRYREIFQGERIGAGERMGIREGLGGEKRNLLRARKMEPSD
jgi:hypothetical protein